MSTVAASPTASTHGPRQRAFIRPRRGWSALDLGEVWRYRDLLLMLAKRDVMVRYKQASLGVLWAIFVPLTQMGVFVIFFGHVLGAGAKASAEAGRDIAYPVFLLVAQVPWNFFASTVNSASNSLVGDANLLRKVYFPRLIVPLSAVGAPIVDFVIAFGVLLGIMVWYELPILPALAALPLLMISVTAAAMGVGLLLASLTVSYRDFRSVIPVLVQLWFFITPVIVSTSWLGGRWQWLLMLNPMAGPIEAFRSIVLGQPVNWLGWAISMGTTAVFLMIGVAYFCRVERRFADVV